MWEKYEKWWILGLIALAIYWFWKKGQPSAGVESQSSGIFSSGFLGSLVNPLSEPGAVNPAQTTSPIVFNPAQPSTVGISQRVSAGQYTFYPSTPVLRYPMPAPAQYAPSNRLSQLNY